MVNESANARPQDQAERSAAVVDVQIIGRGLAGLLAANLAVDAGLSVRLIGRNDRVGGRGGSRLHHGFTLNHGPHALYLDGELASILERLGIIPTGPPPPLSGGTGLIGDRSGVLPTGLGSLLRTPLLPARGKLDQVRFLARLARTNPADLAGTTVADWIDGQTTVPELRALLRGLTNIATYNAAADLASADAAVIQLQYGVFKQGVIYLDGGWASIVDALQQRLDAAGRQATTSTTIGTTTTGAVDQVDALVTAVETDGDGAYLAHIDQDGDATPLKAHNLIVATGLPAVTDRLLGTSLTDAAGPPVMAAVLDLGLRRRPPVPLIQALDRNLYGSLHSVAADVSADRELMTMARYLQPNDDPTPEQVKGELLNLAASAGVADDDIIMQRYLHRVPVTGGMPLAATNGLAGRPPSAVPGRPGIHVAGDWVGHRGVLADAAAASAADAVSAIVASGRRATGPQRGVVGGGRTAVATAPVR